jgi:hypothetical protein
MKKQMSKREVAVYHVVNLFQAPLEHIRSTAFWDIFLSPQMRGVQISGNIQAPEGWF